MGRKKMRLVVSAAVIISICFVSAIKAKQLSDSEDSSDTNSDQIFSKPAQPMPPLQKVSNFFSEIDQEDYPPAKSPENPPLLRWDFSGKAVYAYDFYQKAVNVSKMLSMEDSMEQDVEATATLLLKSQGDHTAILVLKDFKLKALVSGVGEGAPKQVEEEPPDLTVEGVEEDGSIDPDKVPEGSPLEGLFPLPKKPLNVGESVEMPEDIPFNMAGSTLHAKGVTTITLVKYVTIDGHVCAKLVAATDISELDVPGNLEGDYRIFVKGKSVFYFDLESKRFVGGNTALIMSMRIEAPMPKMDFPEGAPPIDMPDTIRMAMDSDNLIKLKLNPEMAK